MRYSCKASVEYDLQQHYKLHDIYTEELNKRSDYQGCLIKIKEKKGREYYSFKPPEARKFEYRGVILDPDIIATKEYAFYQKALDVIETNIVALETMLNVYKKTNAENINELLTHTYALPRNSAILFDDAKICGWLEDKVREKKSYPIFDPNGLKVTAFDGTKMRSRAEAIHYEAFYIYNVPSIYELPYEVAGEVYRPDFTILDVYRMRDVIWEHLGNWFHENEYKRQRYRSDSVHRWDVLYGAGFQLEDNLLLSFGSEENVFDIQSLHRKVAILSVPPPSEETISTLSRC